MQDLIDDMANDEELKGKTAKEIVNHIRCKACSEAWFATTQFVQQYKKYCKKNGLEAETVNCHLN